ncbi:galactose mutarotase [Belliella sp. DSM 107340]|uniref:Aldose 1-epimerase n=1 Tax=Belliella calami TaxID=2923436 RepID=A0ABS9URU1_9BACT|nr:aldose epimerase family protein [Belliella calami]MCH7399336.1 galactose mutarotase [Belliella calami]
MLIKPAITAQPFGKTLDGEDVKLYTIEIPGVIKASIMDYGATLTHLFVPDRDGKMADVVLGFDNFDGYQKKEYLDNYCYIGSTVGRIGGRIKGNQFELDGKNYILEPNNGKTHLHGGKEGWDRKLWEAESFSDEDSFGVTFSMISPDGEGGYPGTIRFKVTYLVNPQGELTLKYQGTTDKVTILNPTNHSYFNLSGDFSKSILDHEFQISANNFLPMDENSMPTGELKDVRNTPFDFLEGKKIGQAIDREVEQIKFGNGIDHSFALDFQENCAKLYDPISGRLLELSTTEPGVQVYTSNYLNGNIKGKNDVAYGQHCAICLETQHFPDSINQQSFPSVILRQGEIFSSKTIFKFSTH